MLFSVAISLNKKEVSENILSEFAADKQECDSPLSGCISDSEVRSSSGVEPEDQQIIPIETYTYFHLLLFVVVAS